MSKNKHLEWATTKQIEGMEEFCAVADEYGNFDVEFKQSDWADDESSRFYAIVSWGTKGDHKNHTFDIAYNYEPTWDCHYKPVEFWQFIFADGDCTKEISTEVFFVELFSYLDNIYPNQIKALLKELEK